MSYLHTSVLMDTSFSYPLITDERELELVAVLRDKKKSREEQESACKELTLSHLRIVRSVAAKLCSREILARHSDDIFCAGAIGLLIAISKLDPTKGFLRSYCRDWIRTEIQEYLRKGVIVVKGPTHQQYKKILAGGIEREILSIPKSHHSLNAPLSASTPGNEEGLEWIDVLPDESGNILVQLEGESCQARFEDAIESALGTLSSREADIVRSRVLTEDPCRFHVLAEKYGVSKERVRQLQQRALAKIGRHITHHFSDVPTLLFA